MLAATDSLAGQIQDSRTRLWSLIRDYISSYAARRPVRQIAVVGNAPLPPSEARAAAIDAADLVIRTNSLVLDESGTPPSVGRSCHVVVASINTRMTPWVLKDYKRRAYLIPQAGWDVHPTTTLRDDLRLVTTFWPADLGAMPLPNALVKAAILPLLDPTRPRGTLLPTTGTMALFLGHELFPEAELLGTGFSFLDDDTQTAWSHHSGGHTTVHPHHVLSLEAALLRSWIADGSLRVLT